MCLFSLGSRSASSLITTFNDTDERLRYPFAHSMQNTQHAKAIRVDTLPKKRSWRWRANIWDRWSRMSPSFHYNHALSKLSRTVEKQQEGEKVLLESFPFAVQCTTVFSFCMQWPRFCQNVSFIIKIRKELWDWEYYRSTLMKSKCLRSRSRLVLNHLAQQQNTWAHTAINQTFHMDEIQNWTFSVDLNCVCECMRMLPGFLGKRIPEDTV